MRNLSFAHYILRCRANPSLAQKSAFEMYQNYQRVQKKRVGSANGCLSAHKAVLLRVHPLAGLFKNNSVVRVRCIWSLL